MQLFKKKIDEMFFSMRPKDLKYHSALQCMYSMGELEYLWLLINHQKRIVFQIASILPAAYNKTATVAYAVEINLSMVFKFRKFQYKRFPGQQYPERTYL